MALVCLYFGCLMSLLWCMLPLFWVCNDLVIAQVAYYALKNFHPTYMFVSIYFSLGGG
jgi:hypothetical protein